MKIVCDSCGAKYSIADEKVAGKVFKIRCKKCSEVIVVRGDQLGGEQPQEEATQVYDYGNDENPNAVWHAVVNGDQQGPFAPEQLADMMNAGTIDWEVYVWREGFDNWLAARDVPDLVAAITGQPAEPAAAAAPAAGGYDAPQASPFGGGGDAAAAGGGLFAASADDSFGGGGGGGADLFAQHDAASSPFEGGAPDDDVVASQPSPRVGADQAMTGQRNENSVLFSLSNLQALATGPSASPAPSMSASAAKPGHASGEGSGLIDIRALASATGVSGGGGGGGAAPAMGGGAAKKENVDDLLSIGTGSPMMGGLGAPILAPVQEEKSNKGMIIAIAAAAGVIALAAVAIIVVLVTKEPEPIAQASGAPVATTGAGAIPPGADTAAPTTGTGTGTTGTTGTTPTTAEPVAPTEPADATEEGDDEGDESGSSGSSRSGSSRHRRGSSGSSGSSSGSSSSSSGSSEPSSSAATMVTSMGSSDIDDLLNNALGSGSSMTAMSSGSSGGGGGGGSDLPDTPTRDQVSSALRSVQGAVSSCGGGQHGVAMAAITVSGSSGRVTNVNVTGQFAGTPVGSCVARAVRGAQFPRFRRSTFNVSFPYRI